jgi:hypothetical protein
LFKAAILAVERVSHHRTKGDANLHSSTDQFHGDLELGAKLRVLLALDKVLSWSIGFEVHWVVDAFIGPQTRHRDHSCVNEVKLVILWS